MLRLGILASGNLGYIVIDALKSEFVPLFIASDSNSFKIIEYANLKNIPLFLGNPRKGRLKSFLINNFFDLDLLLSINYLFIIENDVIELASYAINFHGSLLPKYRGRTPHVWAIINGEKKTGITAHFIEADCDSGPIVLQKEIRIKKDDTGGVILEQFEQLYPSIVNEIICQIANNTVVARSQNHNLSTYFGKRTPEDGEINWEWQKERIRNWVRAQAYPYPGAFTTLKGEKIIIDKISYSNLGFHSDMANGLVIQDIPPIIVKTPNGAIVLDEVRINRNLIVKGSILGSL